MEVLADALHTCHVQELYLEYNRISAKPIPRLAESLKHNRHLRVLEMQNNLLCGRGAHALSKCFRYNTTLQTIDLLVRVWPANSAGYQREYQRE